MGELRARVSLKENEGMHCTLAGYVFNLGAKALVTYRDHQSSWQSLPRLGDSAVCFNTEVPVGVGGHE